MHISRLGRLAPFAAAGLTTLALAMLCACGGGEPGDAAASSAQNRPGGPGGERPAQPPVNVAVSQARRGSIHATYQATATLEAEKQAEVLARVSGVVKSLAREEGDRIDAGGTLLEIENDEYRLRLMQARANRENLQAKFERLEPMARGNLVSQEEFDATRSQLETAKAEEELAQLNLSYTQVRAPFAGRVVQRLVDPGQTVSVGTPLFTVADFEPLLARIHVPSKEFRRLQADQSVELVLDSTGARMHGKITLVSPTIDPQTGTIKISVEIPQYPAGTRPGDFAQVFVITEQRPDALLIPREAVLSEKGEDVVYVAKDGSAERRAVRLGLSNSQDAEIQAGVEVGESVVVKGQRSLQPGAALKVMADDSSR
jgi:membrane fusion protein (multidrug efflux system)